MTKSIPIDALNRGFILVVSTIRNWGQLMNPIVDIHNNLLPLSYSYESCTTMKYSGVMKYL